MLDNKWRPSLFFLMVTSLMRVDADGDEMLLYFLESGDSCALSMGTYMGPPRAASALSPSATPLW